VMVAHLVESSLRLAGGRIGPPLQFLLWSYARFGNLKFSPKGDDIKEN